jgi:hypothetical protein
MHWFFCDDLTYCVDGTMRKYPIVRPSIPTLWPIQEEINLIQKVVTTLEEARFSFHRNRVQNLFSS